MKRLFFAVLFLNIFFTAILAFAEEITLTTIMPTQDTLRVKRGVVGNRDDNKDGDLEDAGDWNYMTIPETTIGQDTLLVGEKIGIGTSSPQRELDIRGSFRVMGGGQHRGVSSTPGSGLEIYYNESDSSYGHILSRTYDGHNTYRKLMLTGDSIDLQYGTRDNETTVLSISNDGAVNKVRIIGNLNVTGDITKSNCYFDIPHPDPDKPGWRLRHAMVESPTRGDNLYRYKVQIERDGGEAEIALPPYWKHLNENPQVWVTAANQFAEAYGYVDESLGKLVVRGEKKGEYNVLLVGTRKDKIAKDSFDTLGVEYQAKPKKE